MTTVELSEELSRARWSARPAAEALDPLEMGAGRHTRHSFARSFIRAAAAGRWRVGRERWRMDAGGRGHAVYRVEVGDRMFRFVVFATTLPEQQRTDRVIAKAWDVTAALVEGEVSPSRLQALRAQVPYQEHGRADADTLIWTRANRSQRFFDYVVDRLARGHQPEPAAMGDAAYILRSTAFYSNGKFGMADFAGLPHEHPLAVPYRAQMLAAWLLRELSYDLAEHCASHRSPTAARLSGSWRRFLGLGNATGLGMVPYVINHPRVLNAWCQARELPLAYALNQPTTPEGPLTARLQVLLGRACEYFRERDTLPTAPYLSGPKLAGQLEQLAALLAEYARAGTVAGTTTRYAWHALHQAADAVDREARGVLDALLVEPYEELDGEVEALLQCDETLAVHPGQSCQVLREQVVANYGWVRHWNFTNPDTQTYFWYASVDNEEPRRGLRGSDPGETIEHPLDVARAVTALLDDLSDTDPAMSVAEFLLAHPWHRGVIARVQSLADLPYAEVRANLLDREFLPLHLQRFQLAMYGMDNYSPQSTDWLRVTLFSGAPRASDVAAGLDDDWFFPRKPADTDR